MPQDHCPHQEQPVGFIRTVMFWHRCPRCSWRRECCVSCGSVSPGTRWGWSAPGQRGCRPPRGESIPFCGTHHSPYDDAVALYLHLRVHKGLNCSCGASPVGTCQFQRLQLGWQSVVDGIFALYFLAFAALALAVLPFAN